MCNLVEQKVDSADSMSYLDHCILWLHHIWPWTHSSIDARYVSTALWKLEYLICIDETGSMMNKVLSYQWTRQTYVSLLQLCTAALCYVPLCLKVKPSPMLSSGLFFTLVQQCLLMKSLDLWTSAIGRSKISLIILREQETSMFQSTNDQPFTNHFKMRTLGYYFMLNCLATLWSIFSTPLIAHQICISTSCSWSFKRDVGCQYPYQHSRGHLKEI